MAIFVFTDGSITLGGVDMSDHITEISCEETAVELDATNFGSAGWMARRGGLKSFKVDIKWQQDFASSEVDQTLNTAGLGGSIGFTAKATSAANSATNPQFTGSLLITQLPRLTGKVGDLHALSTSWNSSGGSLNRATS